MKAFTLDQAIQQQLKNKKFRTYYERELLINSIAKMVHDLRLAKDLTQTELAMRAGTTQAVIARLESGKGNRIPSIPLLAKIAEASNAKLNLEFKLSENV